eukprot:gnl/MRDRNA2_/MRDRNA2_29992_c0_seq1.p1 gnl/MRDRNA2_/MRDRNA2_29992_c0~~gnl/MRDRNA2_/MRDRNA2_29992_c0_seq1.p1  ORF type:complete len:1091 (+),score=232.97 gnl/MRDRNA2_/MRDRNA2_29992_c0_seq1:63-3335(+)
MVVSALLQAHPGVPRHPTGKMVMLAETGLQGAIRSAPQDAGTLRDRQLHLALNSDRGPALGLQDKLQAPAEFYTSPSLGFRTSSLARGAVSHPVAQDLPKAVSSRTPQLPPGGPQPGLNHQIDTCNSTKTESSPQAMCVTTHAGKQAPSHVDLRSVPLPVNHAENATSMNLDGKWYKENGGHYVGTISGIIMYWQDGIETTLSPIRDDGTRVMMELEGDCYTGDVHLGQIHWSDGDVWERRDSNDEASERQTILELPERQMLTICGPIHVALGGSEETAPQQEDFSTQHQDDEAGLRLVFEGALQQMREELVQVSMQLQTEQEQNRRQQEELAAELALYKGLNLEMKRKLPGFPEFNLPDEDPESVTLKLHVELREAQDRVTMLENSRRELELLLDKKDQEFNHLQKATDDLLAHCMCGKSPNAPDPKEIIKVLERSKQELESLLQKKDQECKDLVQKKDEECEDLEKACRELQMALKERDGEHQEYLDLKAKLADYGWEFLDLKAKLADYTVDEFADFQIELNVERERAASHGGHVAKVTEAHDGGTMKFQNFSGNKDLESPSEPKHGDRSELFRKPDQQPVEPQESAKEQEGVLENQQFSGNPNVKAPSESKSRDHSEPLGNQVHDPADPQKANSSQREAEGMLKNRIQELESQLNINEQKFTHLHETQQDLRLQLDSKDSSCQELRFLLESKDREYQDLKLQLDSKQSDQQTSEEVHCLLNKINEEFHERLEEKDKELEQLRLHIANNVSGTETHTRVAQASSLDDACKVMISRSTLTDWYYGVNIDSSDGVHSIISSNLLNDQSDIKISTSRQVHGADAATALPLDPPTQMHRQTYGDIDGADGASRAHAALHAQSKSSGSTSSASELPSQTCVDQRYASCGSHPSEALASQTETSPSMRQNLVQLETQPPVRSAAPWQSSTDPSSRSDLFHLEAESLPSAVYTTSLQSQTDPTMRKDLVELEAQIPELSIRPASVASESRSHMQPAMDSSVMTSDTSLSPSVAVSPMQTHHERGSDLPVAEATAPQSAAASSQSQVNQISEAGQVLDAANFQPQPAPWHTSNDPVWMRLEKLMSGIPEDGAQVVT